MEASQTQGDAPDQNEGGGTPDQPDNAPAVEPTQGTQGESVPEAEGGDVGRISPPPPDAQSGVPALPENEGVEPQPENAGPVGDSGQAPGGPHAEANQADNAAEGTAPGEGEPPAEEPAA